MTIKQYGGVFGRNPSFNDVSVETLSIAGTTLASTAAELNILDGVTADATEINYLDGASTSVVTASKAVLANASANIAFASGKGIDFSATAGTGTSELLADYEEGTWTPGVDGTTSGTAGGYLFNNALYTKVGRQVTVQASIVISAIGTLVGNFKITGLPFTSGGAFPSTYAAAVGFSNVPSAGAGYNMQARVGHASTTLDIFRETGGVSSACPVGATFEFDVVATYFV
jgi:hypothetical protein